LLYIAKEVREKGVTPPVSALYPYLTGLTCRGGESLPLLREGGRGGGENALFLRRTRK